MEILTSKEMGLPRQEAKLRYGHLVESYGEETVHDLVWIGLSDGSPSLESLEPAAHFAFAIHHFNWSSLTSVLDPFPNEVRSAAQESTINTTSYTLKTVDMLCCTQAMNQIVRPESEVAYLRSSGFMTLTEQPWQDADARNLRIAEECRTYRPLADIMCGIVLRLIHCLPASVLYAQPEISDLEGTIYLT